MAQVNYVGKGGNLYESGYEYHGSALVVSKLLGATYLWDKAPMLDRGKAEPLGPLWDTPLMNLPGFNNDKQNHSNNNWVGITYIILLFASLCPKFAETHNIHQAPSCHHRCVWWEAPTVASAASIPAAETSSTSPTAIPTWGKPWRPTMGRQVFLGPVGEVGGIDQGLQPERIMNDSFWMISQSMILDGVCFRVKNGCFFTRFFKSSFLQLETRTFVWMNWIELNSQIDQWHLMNVYQVPWDRMVYLCKTFTVRRFPEGSWTGRGWVDKGRGCWTVRSAQIPVDSSLSHFLMLIFGPFHVFYPANKHVSKVLSDLRER